MAKAVMVVAQKGFRDEELLIPKEILEGAGIEITVASLTRGKATGALGATVEATMAAHEINPEYFDAVIIIGGPGSPVLRKSRELLENVKKAYENGKIVAAICLAPTVLAMAGVLNGKKSTVYPTDESIAILKKNGAEYVAEGVVVDGRIVTADGPKSANDFGNKLVEMLK